MIGELSHEFVHAGQTIRIWPHAHDRNNSGFTVGKKFETICMITVPVSALSEVWGKVVPATRAGELGYGTAVCVCRDLQGLVDPDFRIVEIFLGECKDQQRIKLIEQKLQKLGINFERSYTEFEHLSKEDSYDKQILEKVYGKQLILSYRKIIRGSGLLDGTKDEDWEEAERAVLSIMTSYPGDPLISPVTEKRLMRDRSEEFRAHLREVNKLKKQLQEAEQIAYRLLHTRKRDPELERLYQQLKLGDNALGISCMVCGNRLEVYSFDRPRMEAHLRCPLSVKEVDRHHSKDAVISFKSPHDQGLFFDIADAVLQKVMGLGEQISEKLQEVKETLPQKGRHEESYHAEIVARFVDIVIQYSQARNHYARVAKLINSWPAWQGKKLNRDTVEKKHALARRKK